MSKLGVNDVNDLVKSVNCSGKSKVNTMQNVVDRVLYLSVDLNDSVDSGGKEEWKHKDLSQCIIFSSPLFLSLPGI